MTEFTGEFPRSWIEFIDPEHDETIIKADLTWLTSNWECIFGRGCKGVDKTNPNDGCCNQGAHFSEPNDKKRVSKWVEKLTPDIWEKINYSKNKKSWTEFEDGAEKTKIVNGTCIFMNSPEFAGGQGCALHKLAIEKNAKTTETKPDVCWQLPIRRSYETREYENGTDYQVIVIEEYRRKNWGKGGETMDWYCSSDTEAHKAFEPVYISEKNTLIELIGKKSYEILKKHCDERVSLIKTLKKLPGRKAKQILLSINPHPADQLVE
jgi:hypothetical protein